MKTEFLTEWEILVIQSALEKFYGAAHEDKKALLNKVAKASHIRLSYQEAA